MSSSPFTTQKTLLLWLYFVTLYPNPNAATSIPLHFHLRWRNFWVPKPRQSLFLWICLFIYCQHCFKYFLSCYALLFPSARIDIVKFEEIEQMTVFTSLLPQPTNETAGKIDFFCFPLSVVVLGIFSFNLLCLRGFGG